MHSGTASLHKSLLLDSLHWQYIGNYMNAVGTVASTIYPEITCR